MEILYKHLYNIFKEELLRANIGYTFNEATLLYMNDLVNAINYLEEGDPSAEDALTIIQKYERHFNS